MTDWRTVMREAAERDEQDHLSTDEAQAMRRVVLAAVVDDARKHTSSVWMRRPVFVAATVVAIVSVSVAAGLRLDLASRSRQTSTTDETTQSASVAASDNANAIPTSRQLQFMTAGGTRVIWVFNSDLDLKATLR